MREREDALRRAQTELSQARQQITQLQGQLLDAYRQHELRLAALTEKVLAITRAALPSAELQVEGLPLEEAPQLPERTPPEPPPS
jgi:exonuclease VII small subunit